MSEVEQALRPFSRRVRLMGAWQGLAVGLLVAGVLDLVWVGLDWARVFYADSRGLALIGAGGAVAGIVAGYLRRVPNLVLAQSIDRRADLQDRLGTAMEDRSDSLFGAPLGDDAVHSLGRLSPSSVYPVRFGAWHIAAVTAAVLVASIFVLGNSPVLRGPKTASERAELKELGAKVERVAKPLEKPVNVAQTPVGQKKLAGELNQFAKELEQGKINKEEALRKANDLASKAEQEAKDRGQEAEQKLDQAETAFTKMQKAQLESAGLDKQDLENLKLTPEEAQTLEREMQEQGFQNPKSSFNDQQLSELGIDRTTEKLANMTPEQRDQLRQAISKRQEEVQKEIDRIDKLPEAERKALEQQRQELQKQSEELKKLMDKFKLSEEAMKTLKEFMQSEEMKKVREAMQNMQSQAQQMQQGQKLTKEQMDELAKQLQASKEALEKMAKDLKDPELRKQIAQQMEEAMKQLQSGQMSQQAMMQMMQSFGMQSGDSDGEASSDDNFADTGKVNKSEHEMETKGNTRTTGVKGQWADKGEQWSMTIKAPTQVGNRSSVPYQKVLPQYKSAAERALSGGKIPKEQEKRVKEYFDSLSGGKG
ncbi:MAG: hypothetical protein JSS66_10440 [Armatimonadetes bacterium]|nr:hypothetical protein [Armatimonadota bacterium]